MARSRAVNLTLIVIYKGKVRRTWRTTVFFYVNISVRRYFSSFGCTPSSGVKAEQCFIHEAPGVGLGTQVRIDRLRKHYKTKESF